MRTGDGGESNGQQQNALLNTVISPSVNITLHRSLLDMELLNPFTADVALTQPVIYATLERNSGYQFLLECVHLLLTYM